MKKTRKIHKDNEILAVKDSMTDTRLEKITKVAHNRQANMMVVMEDVYNPYNLAAIARSCDAFGVQYITAILENSKNFNPKEIVNIAATSASKWLTYRIFETEGTTSALTTLKEEGWTIVATVAEDQQSTDDQVSRMVHSVYSFDFTKYEKVALLLGNEHTGLSEKAIALADQWINIPMSGMLQSFNVSVASAILLFEITRQRRATGDYQKFLLPEEEANELTEDFLMRRMKSN